MLSSLSVSLLRLLSQLVTSSLLCGLDECVHVHEWRQRSVRCKVTSFVNRMMLQAVTACSVCAKHGWEDLQASSGRLIDNHIGCCSLQANDNILRSCGAARSFQQAHEMVITWHRMFCQCCLARTQTETCAAEWIYQKRNTHMHVRSYIYRLSPPPPPFHPISFFCLLPTISYR